MQKIVESTKLYLNDTPYNNVTNLRFVPKSKSQDSINKQKPNNVEKLWTHEDVSVVLHRLRSKIDYLERKART